MFLCYEHQLYNFGETVSIVLWTDTWKPDSFYDKIAANKKQGLHTLCLLGRSLILCISPLKEKFAFLKNFFVIQFSYKLAFFIAIFVNPIFLLLAGRRGQGLKLGNKSSQRSGWDLNSEPLDLQVHISINCSAFVHLYVIPVQFCLADIKVKEQSVENLIR